MVFYTIPGRCGLDIVSSLGDGETINVKWRQAYPDNSSNKIAYYIYYSTLKEDVYSEGVKYVSIDDSLEANIINLTPGQLYYFSVRPIEYDSDTYNLSNILPIAYDNLRICASSLLRSNITATGLIIPLLDISDFPSSGFIKAGAELIQYSSIDQIQNNLLVPSASFIDGYLIEQNDGYYTPNPNNIGDGYLIGLTLVNTNIQTETWNIECVGVQKDIYGNNISGTAKFISIGSITGTKRDGYTNPIIWIADGYTISNGIFSFSILENNIFSIGDSFLIKIEGSRSIKSGRGCQHTLPISHNTSGFDGYVLWNPQIVFYVSGEDNRWDNIFMCQSRFEYPNFQYTTEDGYHQITKDILTTDLSVSDESNSNYPSYDYSSYHRVDPTLLLNGTCVGSYIGGEYGCIDKYGNEHILRGLSLQDRNIQRQEILLSITGRPAVLIKRRQTGITCSCYLPSSQYPDDRCPVCGGGKFVTSYEQYFNSRRSDGRILVRISPSDENLKMYESGLESELALDIWTLTVPTIKSRDIIILFDIDDNEEFRYEVLTVTRNTTILGMQGAQKMKVSRIRKTDPAYQIRAFRNTSELPSKFNTTIGLTTGISPHTHECVRNEKDISTWSQTTSVSQGHNHQVVYKNNELIVMTGLGHNHRIIP